jgi:hypothetical protein
VISKTHLKFRRDFARLPGPVQHRARDAYRRFQSDPSHPALQFKPLHATLPIWSVRITDSYRAVGVRKNDDEIVWFFIGTHADYDKLLASL